MMISMNYTRHFLFFLLCGFTLHLNSFAAGKYDIVVSADGSGDFSSVQEAINSCKGYRPEEKTIFIKNGIYREKVIIPSYLQNIHIIGECRDSTVISYADHVGMPGIGTFSSYTFKVAGNAVILENLTIENTSGRVGQAVALHVEGDRVQVKNCRLLGNQDTLYATGWLSRQYYTGCHIEGTVDFIFGAATAVFDDCTLLSKDNSYITAASTPGDVPYGFVFLNCRLAADTGVVKAYLGRPWGDFAKVAYINCTMGGHIVPAGWDNWGKPERETTSFYAEYKCSGPGADRSHRAPWSHTLTNRQVKKYRTENIFQISNNWNPVK
jgi:pectinesterase